MVLLWMLWIAIICKSSQGDGITSTPSDKELNSKIINLTSAVTQGLSTSIDSSKPTRDKRGTGQLLEKLLRRNDLVGADDEEGEKVKRTRGAFIESPRMRFSSWAGKRAKFSSWGGKRNDQGLLNDVTGSADYDLNEDKRAKFSSWAGKRAGEDEPMNWAAANPGEFDHFNQLEDKRAKFSSWAGKRDENNRRFSSWGGKRFDIDSNSNINDITEDKRAKFSSWAGKRAKFNSWGGKRFSNDGNDDEDNDGSEYEDNIIEGKRKSFLPWRNNDEYSNGKRAKFSSWGGKRANDEWWNLKRARFNSWGGKRNVNVTNTNDLIDHEDGIYKRSPAAYTPLSWKRKPIFSSWGGKRTARSAQLQRRLILPSNLFRERSSWGALLRPIRRGPDFYAWGGKRST